MKLENVKITEEQLFSRKKLTADITSEGTTPSKKDFVVEIAKSTGSKEELVVIIKIDTFYGSRKSKVAAYVYNDLTTKNKITGNTKKERAADKKGKEEALKKHKEEKAAKAPAEKAE